MTIHISKDEARQLTVFTAQGPLEVDEILKIISDFLTHHPTNKVLWDLRQASLNQWRVQEIERMIEFISPLAHNRPQGKTALLTQRDVDFGLTRMAAAHAQNLPIQYMSFKSLDQAMEWLDQNE